MEKPATHAYNVSGETLTGNGTPAVLSYTDADHQDVERIISNSCCSLSQDFPYSDDAHIFGKSVTLVTVVLVT
jgi:hypothetical protein